MSFFGIFTRFEYDIAENRNEQKYADVQDSLKYWFFCLIVSSYKSHLVKHNRQQNSGKLIECCRIYGEHTIFSNERKQWFHSKIWNEWLLLKKGYSLVAANRILPPFNLCMFLFTSILFPLESQKMVSYQGKETSISEPDSV